jgi:hypothetical protein
MGRVPALPDKRCAAHAVRSCGLRERRARVAVGGSGTATAASAATVEGGASILAIADCSLEGCPLDGCWAVALGCSVMMGCCSALASAKPLALAGRFANEPDLVTVVCGAASCFRFRVLR